jgi:hypothetical protein
MLLIKNFIDDSVNKLKRYHTNNTIGISDRNNIIQTNIVYLTDPVVLWGRYHRRRDKTPIHCNIR